ncbi:hypothetical protein ABZ322_32405, partial [Streptomyces sp. NPDC006129]
VGSVDTFVACTGVLITEEGEASPDGTWTCTPGPALPPGANRLQAVAALNGVNAMSEQIDIAVTTEATAGQ